MLREYEPGRAVLPGNPLREGLDRDPTPEPCAIVIFGASGDLTARKLMPALFQLAAHRRLPPEFATVGFARTPMSTARFRKAMRQALRAPAGSPEWRSFAETMHYCSGDYDDSAAFRRLARLLESLERRRGVGRNRIFYLATPPSAMEGIVGMLGAARLARGEGWARIVVEKPFGRDVKSAHTLNQLLGATFPEEAVYRIDHYLGKETVQNILVLRFANGIFEPVWNRRYVDHVQITVAEQQGVGGRGAYYEEAGALRDMVQNHLFQLLCLVAMEPPVSRQPDAIRNETVKVLQAVRPLPTHPARPAAVRGQYGPGWIAGSRVAGYRQEARVSRQSGRETYAALRILLDNWRWSEVPFYLRSGKRLARRVTEIAIQFRLPPQLLFAGSPASAPQPNVLALRIQPDEGIDLRFEAKSPGAGTTIRPVVMEFDYGESFGVAVPDAYERLLLDAMLGDPTLFARADWVERAWGILTPILSAWEERDGGEIERYRAGSAGPAAAGGLLEREGRRWRPI